MYQNIEKRTSKTSRFQVRLQSSKVKLRLQCFRTTTCQVKKSLKTEIRPKHLLLLDQDARLNVSSHTQYVSSRNTPQDLNASRLQSATSQDASRPDEDSRLNTAQVVLKFPTVVFNYRTTVNYGPTTDNYVERAGTTEHYGVKPQTTELAVHGDLTSHFDSNQNVTGMDMMPATDSSYCTDQTEVMRHQDRLKFDVQNDTHSLAPIITWVKT
ncbi:hypothetical protein B0H14DRAFT_2580918 [Mycena olivaceomarginata]|nr:hypothetical protein B0H14DRAFT_2580918 [Mycena olivaceomarginata]